MYEKYLSFWLSLVTEVKLIPWTIGAAFIIFCSLTTVKINSLKL
jgi:hypothetical protein